MTTLVIVGASVVAGALAAAVARGRRDRTGRRVPRRRDRAGGADPYARQRKPEKLNPGLGGFGAGGG